MRRILYWLRLVDLVWFNWYGRSYDRLRVVWRDADGNGYVKQGRRCGRMLPDGKFEVDHVDGWTGCEGWLPYNQHPTTIAKQKAKQETNRLTWRRPSKATRVAARLKGEQLV